MNRFLLLYTFLFLFISAVLAQPSKDGVYTATANVVVNKYAPVTSDISVGSATLSVLNQTATLKLCPGDLILIYQAQGAAINTTNTIAYGDVTAYNGAGLYEFAYVKEANANTITTTATLSNSYLASGMVQAIRVPQYSTLTVNANATITAAQWRDTTVANVLYRFGGIVAVQAGYINNNGFVSADGKGFRGGASDPSTFGTATSSNITGYTSSVTTEGGEKGESIVGYGIEYDLLGGRYGRGAPANGGGGGNAWNSGGGGGANANSGSVWTGQGIMDGNAFGAVAWGLDPAYIANGNNLTTSSGGGRGGYSVGLTLNNPLTIAPGNTQWGGDNRKEVGGIGGRPLLAQPTKRLFFGGGGGAGDENNFCSNNGGNGGGLVFVIASTELAGTGTISSIGGTGGNTKNAGLDAASGGGGGGSLMVLSPSISATQLLIVKGGHGGSQTQSVNEAEGPGGGGGSGYIVSSSGSVLLNISGGDNGVTFSNIMIPFPSNGATMGAKGQFTTTPYSFITYNVNNIVTASVNSPICKGETFSLTSAGPSNAAFNWAGPNNFAAGSQNVLVANTTTASAGVYTLSMAPEGCAAIKVTVNAAFGSCVGVNEFSNDNASIKVYPSPAREFIRVENIPNEATLLQIYDSKGMMCLEQAISGDCLNLSVEQLPQGIYTIVISNRQQKLIAKKIAVE